MRLCRLFTEAHASPSWTGDLGAKKIQLMLAVFQAHRLIGQQCESRLPEYPRAMTPGPTLPQSFGSMFLMSPTLPIDMASLGPWLGRTCWTLGDACSHGLIIKHTTFLVEISDPDTSYLNADFRPLVSLYQRVGRSGPQIPDLLWIAKTSRSQV